MHDYERHKEFIAIYREYLLKTPEEDQLLPHDRANRYWALLADMAFIGPEADTAPVRRITPNRSNQVVYEQRHNEEVSRLRNPIEWLFGRLWRQWGILRFVYRWDHKHFDSDYDICCLLTNELMRTTDLNERDYEFYMQVCTKRRQDYEEQQRKRKEAQDKNKEYRRRRRRQELGI